MRFSAISIVFLAAAVPAFAAPVSTASTAYLAKCTMPTTTELRDQACKTYPNSHLCNRLQNHTASATSSATASAAPHARKLSAGGVGEGVNLICSILPETCQAVDNGISGFFGSLKVRDSKPKCTMPSTSQLRDEACKQHPNSHLCHRLQKHMAKTAAPSKGTVSRRQGAIGVGITAVETVCTVFKELCSDAEHGIESLL